MTVFDVKYFNTNFTDCRLNRKQFLHNSIRNDYTWIGQGKNDK